jgi:hypothetical protein
LSNNILKRTNTKDRFDFPIKFKNAQLGLTLMEERVVDFIFKATSSNILKQNYSEEYLYGVNIDESHQEELTRIVFKFEDFRDFYGVRDSKSVLEILEKIENNKIEYNLNLFALENGKINYSKEVQSNGKVGFIMDVKEDKSGRKKIFSFLIPKAITQILSTEYNYTILYSPLNKSSSTIYSYRFIKEIMYHVRNGRKKWSIEAFRKDLQIPDNISNARIKTMVIGKILRDFKDSEMILKEPIYTYSKPGEGKKTITHIEFRYSLKDKFSLETKLFYYKKFLSEEVEYELFNELFEHNEVKFRFEKVSNKKIKLKNVKNGMYLKTIEAKEAMEYLWENREQFYRHIDEDEMEQNWFYDCRVEESTMSNLEYKELEFDLFFNAYIQKCKDKEKQLQIERKEILNMEECPFDIIEEKENNENFFV